MSMKTCLQFLAPAAIAIALGGAAWATDLRATITTTEGKLIDVTAISSDGRIEYTPAGGKKTNILFKDIKKIEWDKNTRIHTVTTLDGKTLQLERAWIFVGRSVHMEFTGTDRETGEDANGTVTGSDIAGIEFAEPAPQATQAPSTPEPAEPAAEPAAPSAPAAAARPAAPVPEKKTGPSKRLPTNNIDYTKDAIAAFEQAIPGFVKAYDEAKAAGSLTADEKDPNTGDMEPKDVLIQRKAHKLFHEAVKYYTAALQDGWEATDAELAPHRDKLVAMLPELEKIGYKSCFNPGDAPCDNLENMDRARLEAYKAMLLTTARGNAGAGKELMEQVGKTREQTAKAFADDNQAGHPALKRFQEEVKRMEQACEAGFAEAGKEKEAALAAWQALRDEREKLRETTYKIENGNIHPMNWAAFLDELEKFEKTDSAVVKQKIEYLGKLCGAKQDALEAAMEALLDKNPSGWDWSAEVKYFDKIFSAIPKLRKDTADAIVEQANQNLQFMSSFAEAIRAKKFEELKQLVQLGLRYDPHNAALIDLVAKVEETAAGDAAAIEKQIAERQWPGNHKGFAGPGTPEELTKAALDYFNSTCKPTEKALTACIVEPDWYCFKRNIFGQPVQWALTFWVAVDVEGETTPDLVYAWSISFITEENVGVEKAPPFKWAAFNFKQKMKRANVPGLK